MGWVIGGPSEVAQSIELVKTGDDSFGREIRLNHPVLALNQRIEKG